MKNVRAKVECKDGFKFSVVANPDVRCSDPVERWGRGHWVDAEIGYPSSPDELLQEYASSGPAGRIPETYDYVPMNVVKALVRKHGGVSSTTKWCCLYERPAG